MIYITLNETNFRKEVLESRQPVLVEFFTDWSGSCHIIGPAIKELAEQFGTRVKFCKINMDEQEKIAIEYGVQKIPTILFLKYGQVVDHIIGVVPKKIIVEKLKVLLQPENLFMSLKGETNGKKEST